MKKHILSIVVCLFVAALFVQQGYAAVSMPHFNLTAVKDGKTVSSDVFKGKALLVTFFATWCPPCRQEIPALIKLQEEFGEQGFSVVALSVDEGGPEIVAKLMEQAKINYPVLMADHSIAREFGGIAGIPTSFLVNKKGHVVKRYPGYVPHALLERDIKMILQ